MTYAFEGSTGILVSSIDSFTGLGVSSDAFVNTGTFRKSNDESEGRTIFAL